MKPLSFPWSSADAPRGNGDPVVLASVLRLYRNLHDAPFPERAGKAEQLAVSETVSLTLEQLLPGFCEIPEFAVPVPKNECACMVEQRLVTPDFAKMRFCGQKVRFSSAGNESIQINGGDHLVLSACGAGLTLPVLWERLNTMDDLLSKKLHFAFHPKYGYLSPDPENAGTGLEISLILHLPGLALMDEIKPMLTAFLRLGLKCCGISDAENKFPGNLYVISNRSKMGETEAQLLARLEKTVLHIVEEELDARERLFRKTPMKAEDFCYRSLAVLTHARMISTVEALNALSGLKLAQDRSIAQELIPADLPRWDDLLLQVMPGHVAAKFPDPEVVTKEQRAVCRAEILRRFFGGKSAL